MAGDREHEIGLVVVTKFFPDEDPIGKGLDIKGWHGQVAAPGSRKVGAAGRPIRAYGEMVDVLWQEFTVGLLIIVAVGFAAALPPAARFGRGPQGRGGQGRGASGGFNRGPKKRSR